MKSFIILSCVLVSAMTEDPPVFRSPGRPTFPAPNTYTLNLDDLFENAEVIMPTILETNSVSFTAYSKFGNNKILHNFRKWLEHHDEYYLWKWCNIINGRVYFYILTQILTVLQLIAT